MQKIAALFMILSFVLAPGFALAQTAQCTDGWVSNSAHFQGTCANHGGVTVWFNKEMEEQANEWCDENPDLCANSGGYIVDKHILRDSNRIWRTARMNLVDAL